MADNSWLDDAEDADDNVWLDNAADADEDEHPEAIATRLAEEKYEQRKPGMLEAASIALQSGAMRNHNDEFIGGAAKLMGKDYTNARDQARVRENQARSEWPKTYGFTEFLAMLGSSPITRNPLAAGAIGAAEGGVSALGRSKAIDRDAAIDTATGATIGGVGGAALTKYGDPLLAAIAKPMRGAYDGLRNVAGRQAVQAMKPTQKMIKDLKKKGIYEDVGKEALDSNIVTPLASNAKMAERSRDFTQQAADETRPIYAKAKDASMTKDQLLAILGARQSALRPEPGKAPIVNKLSGYAQDIETAADAGRKNYNPSDLRNFRRDVDDTINFNSDSPTQLGGKEMRNLLRDQEMGLIEKVDPALRAENEKLFRKIRLGNEMETVAERGEAQNAANNAIGLTSYIIGGAGATTGAALGLDKDTAAVLGGIGLLGREGIRRYGNQVAATGLNNMAKLIASPKYAGIFKQATQRGGSGVAYVHQKLMQEDPEYRQTYEEAQKKTSESIEPQSKAVTAGLGMTNDLTFGFDDEISGGYAGAKAALNQADIGEAYTKQRDRYRQAKGQAETDNPMTYMGSGIASSIAAPGIGMAKKGVSALGRAIAGAKTGATMGGLTGAGGSDKISNIPRDSFESAIKGGFLGGAMGSLAKTNKKGVVESGVGRNQGRINMPERMPDMERSVEVGGKKLKHRVYNDRQGVFHYLFDEATGIPVAELQGMLGKTRDSKPAMNIKWSRASGGQGYGKKLYDLALDTHENIISDVQLSRNGSNRVYTEHFTEQPGVKTELSSWGSMSPHRVGLEDPVAFHNKNKFPPFEPKYSKVREALEEKAIGKKPEGYLEGGPNPPEHWVPPTPAARMPPEIKSAIDERFGWGWDDNDVADFLRERGYNSQEARRMIDKYKTSPQYESPSKSASPMDDLMNAYRDNSALDTKIPDPPNFDKDSWYANMKSEIMTKEKSHIDNQTWKIINPVLDTQRRAGRSNQQMIQYMEAIGLTPEQARRAVEYGF